MQVTRQRPAPPRPVHVRTKKNQNPIGTGPKQMTTAPVGTIWPLTPTLTGSSTVGARPLPTLELNCRPRAQPPREGVCRDAGGAVHRDRGHRLTHPPQALLLPPPSMRPTGQQAGRMQGDRPPLSNLFPPAKHTTLSLPHGRGSPGSTERPPTSDARPAASPQDAWVPPVTWRSAQQHLDL